MAAALLTLGACDTDPAESVPEDPQGPAEQAPGTEGPDAEATDGPEDDD
jgi:hypothetical protein